MERTSLLPPIRSTFLIGEAPARGYDDLPAFSSQSGARITELLGVDLHEVFQCRNLLKRWPGKSSGKGALFPEAEASSAAYELMRRLGGSRESRRLILAGDRVAKAFRVRKEVPKLVWVSFWLGSQISPCRCHEFAVMPHPSGVNRWWNDSDNVRRARQFLLDEGRLTGRLPR